MSNAVIINFYAYPINSGDTMTVSVSTNTSSFSSDCFANSSEINREFTLDFSSVQTLCSVVFQIDDKESIEINMDINYMPLNVNDRVMLAITDQAPSISFFSGNLVVPSVKKNGINTYDIILAQPVFIFNNATNNPITLSAAGGDTLLNAFDDPMQTSDINPVTCGAYNNSTDEYQIEAANNSNCIGSVQSLFSDMSSAKSFIVSIPTGIGPLPYTVSFTGDNSPAISPANAYVNISESLQTEDQSNSLAYTISVTAPAIPSMTIINNSNSKLELTGGFSSDVFGFQSPSQCAQFATSQYTINNNTTCSLAAYNADSIKGDFKIQFPNYGAVTIDLDGTSSATANSGVVKVDYDPELLLYTITVCDKEIPGCYAD